MTQHMEHDEQKSQNRNQKWPLMVARADEMWIFKVFEFFIYTLTFSFHLVNQGSIEWGEIRFFDFGTNDI